MTPIDRHSERLAAVTALCGYANAAAHSLADHLREAGWPVAAYIHPGHLASQHVARAAGLVPTGENRDSEIRRVSPPLIAP